MSDQDERERQRAAAEEEIALARPPLERVPLEEILAQREAATLARSAQLLAEPGPSEGELAETRERAQRDQALWDIIRKHHTNDAGRVVSAGMAADTFDFYCRAGKPETVEPVSKPAPVVFKRNDDAVRKTYATRAELDALAKAVGEGVGKALGERLRDVHAQLADARKELAKVRSEVDQVRGVAEAVDRVAGRVQADLATLRREFDLQQKLAVQNTKRRADLLELENSLLKAGRSPDEALPGKLSEWRDNG